MHFLADDIDALHKFHPDISINYNHIAQISVLLLTYGSPQL